MATINEVTMTATELPMGDDLTTLESHILSEEHRHAGASGTFSWILAAMTLSAKIISSKIRRARIEDVLGSIGSRNASGDDQQKLDVIANETLLRCLGSRAAASPRARASSRRARRTSPRPSCR